MKDLLYAKEQLQFHKLCFVKDNAYYFCDKNGIQGLIDFIENGRDLTHFSVADTIVGKAAALLYAYLGIKAVYANVLSKKAIPIFEKYNIYYEYNVLTEEIINRSKTDICPMEKAVLDIFDPKEAVDRIRKTLMRFK